MRNTPTRSFHLKTLGSDIGKETPFVLFISFPEEAGNSGKEPVELFFGKWQRISLQIPRPEHLPNHEIVLAPLSLKGVLRISSIKLIDLSRKAVLHTFFPASNPDVFGIQGSLLLLCFEDDLVLLVGDSSSKLTFRCPHFLPDVPSAFEMVVKLEERIFVRSLDCSDVSRMLNRLFEEGRLYDADFFSEACGFEALLELADPSLLICVCRLWMDFGHTLKAGALYTKALERRIPGLPMIPELPMRLGQEGCFDEADGLYHAMTDSFPRRWDIWIAWAKMLRKAGRTAQAIDLLRTGIDRFPDRPLLRAELGLLLLYSGNDEMALDAFQHALRSDRTLPLWVNKAASALTREMIDREGIILSVPKGTVSPTILESLIKGGYEQIELEIAQKIIEPNERILELGGGIGYLSTSIKILHNDAEICTMEANPNLMPAIADTHALNNCQIELLHGAASDHDGETDFYLRANFWESSTRKERVFSETSRVPAIDTARVIRNFRPSMLVIDIEGDEERVVPFLPLEGINKILMELHPEVTGPAVVSSLFAVLLKSGFHVDLSHSKGNAFTFLRSHHTYRIK